MLNLLIIDDSVPFLNDVELLLNGKYKIFKADNGKKGINIIKKENISVLLLDLKLPDINGLDILKQVHSDIDPNLSVIIVTDLGDVDTVVKAMSLGAGNDGSFLSAMNKAKHEYFTNLLAETDGNKTKVAERAGLSRQGLLKILKELGIE